MPLIPPTEFTFGKYDRNTIPHSVYMYSLKDYVKWLKSQVIIGYIKGIELEIRPKTDTYGVMIEDEDGFISWSHIPDDVFDKYLKEID
jgi:hypothetical protein